MTSLRCNRPICTPGLLLVAKTLLASNVPFFFEHNMRFLCYSNMLCIQINRFKSEGQA